ncbi:MAG: hypothetical protein WCD20_21100 [Rhodomicrobium sp.]
MTGQTKPGKGVAKVRAFSSPEMAAFQIQLQALLQEQADFLQETQTAMAAWTRRRQEAMEATFKTFAAMGVCFDPAAKNAAYSEWLMGSMDRILLDMDSIRQEALRLAEMGNKSILGMHPVFGKEAWLRNEAAAKASAAV